MKRYAEGNFGKHISVAGNIGYPGYVLKGGSRNLMIDAGLNLLGPLYLKSLDAILGDRDLLSMLFVTHSHYDHLGAAPYLKRKIAGLSLGGSSRVEELLAKSSVLESMTFLGNLQREMFREVTGDEDVSLGPIALEQRLRGGDRFELGGITCEVIEVPGHTRDSLAYSFPEIGALFPGEAVGVPEGHQGDGVQVEFLSSYGEYLRSLEKLSLLKPVIIGMAHGWVFTDDDALSFMERSHGATEKYKNLIESYLDASNGGAGAAVEMMARKEYDEKGTIFQERNAYVTNLKAQVKLIAGLREVPSGRHAG